MRTRPPPPACSPPWSRTDGDLDDWVAEQTRALRQSAPGAVRATKELLRALPAQGWSDGLAAAASTSAELFAGPEATEGMAAFLEKRRPDWDTTP